MARRSETTYLWRTGAPRGRVPMSYAEREAQKSLAAWGSEDDVRQRLLLRARDEHSLWIATYGSVAAARLLLVADAHLDRVHETGLHGNPAQRGLRNTPWSRFIAGWLRTRPSPLATDAAVAEVAALYADVEPLEMDWGGSAPAETGGWIN